MSRLDELIAELCPEGVAYLALKEISVMRRGTSTTKAQTIEGPYPVISGGREPAFYCNEYNREGECITVAGSGAGAGYVQYWNEPIFVNDAFSVVGIEGVSTRYLFHCLSKLQEKIYATKKGGGVPHVHISNIENFRIPVPPLEVQREIVRVLDNFTFLSAELSAELQARKKQYEYYRNELLSFNTGIKVVALENIAEIGTGSSNTNEGLEQGLYPFYVRSQEPLRKNEYEFDETAIITAGDGVGVGKVFHYVEGKYALHQRAYRIHIKSQEVLPRYCYHYMRSTFLSYIHKNMFQGSVASIRRPMLNSFPVPVPSIAVQERIVNVLDNFETLCADLNIGLPAEIEARQKQYEYYRDLLLTFAETGTTVATDRPTDRPTDRLDDIKLLQYVFGYALVILNDIAGYRTNRIDASLVNETSYIGVDNILPNRNGRKKSEYVPDGGRLIRFEPNDILIGNIRPYLKKIWMADIIGGTNGDVLVIEVKDQGLVYPRFLYHVLASDQFFAYDNQHAKGAKMPRGDKAAVMQYCLCLPEYDEQVRVAEILDKYDGLCNDACSGIPAEIEARQRQYEYYRDKLLSFKEKES